MGEMRDSWAYLEMSYQACIWLRIPSLYLTPYTKRVSSSVYLKKAKRKNDDIVQIDSWLIRPQERYPV